MSDGMSDGDRKIAQLSARLTCQGDPAFDDLARSCGVPNRRQSVHDRIRTWAEMDAMVAIAYRLTRDEYIMVLKSFKFRANPALIGEDMDWSDSRALSAMYHRMRELAITYYDRAAHTEGPTPTYDDPPRRAPAAHGSGRRRYALAEGRDGKLRGVAIV